MSETRQDIEIKFTLAELEELDRAIANTWGDGDWLQWLKGKEEEAFRGGWSKIEQGMKDDIIKYMKESETLTDKAEMLGMELIPDPNNKRRRSVSDKWCCRPCLYDDEGREIVTHQPDPYEFKYTLKQVREMLNLRESQVRIAGIKSLNWNERGTLNREEA